MYFNILYNSSNLFNSLNENIFIKNCNFLNINKDFGAGININNQITLLKVEFCFFSFLTSLGGSGIHSQSLINIIHFCCFENCHSSQTWGSALNIYGDINNISFSNTLNCPSSGKISHGNIFGLSKGHSNIFNINFTRNNAGGSLQNGGIIETGLNSIINISFIQSNSIICNHLLTFISSTNINIIFTNFLNNSPNFLIYTQNNLIYLFNCIFLNNLNTLTKSLNGGKCIFNKCYANGLSKFGTGISTTIDCNFNNLSLIQNDFNLLNFVNCYNFYPFYKSFEKKYLKNTIFILNIYQFHLVNNFFD